jgi:hypothetical protein
MTVLRDDSFRLRRFDWINLTISLAALLVAILSAPDSPLKSWMDEVIGVRFVSDHPEFYNTLLFALTSSTLLTIVLFYLLSRIPTLKAQAASRRSLKRSFKRFKLSCIDVFVVVSGYPQNVNY